MKVFISWSGTRSRAMGEALQDWLKLVFADPSLVEPWVSSRDMGAGDWREILKQRLKETDAGIVCVTREAFTPSWMLYEAGVLSKSMENEFVVPYLLDMNKDELEGPLEQFQVSEARKEDTRNLVRTINSALGRERRLDSGDLDQRFEAVWPNLQESLQNLPPADLTGSYRTMRGITLEKAVASSGLVDIENRENRQDRGLPPEQFYEKAKREIVITGVSGYRTFESYSYLIREALMAQKKVHVLILHPNAPGMQRLSTIEIPPIKGAIEQVIEMIRSPRNSFHQDSNFTIKFMQEMPPFTATMIDGDVSPEVDGKPQDQEGQIRIQPRTAYGTQHEGMVLQFKKLTATPDQAVGVFDFFAEDVRSQWQQHGKEYPEFFE